MKKINGIIILLFFLSHWVYGQACGMYKIQYIGKISSNKQIKAVYLPTPDFLEGYVNFRNEDALLKASVNNNQFNGYLISSLGRVYRDEQQILSVYQSKHSKFKIKIEFLSKNVLKTKIIEIDWNDIQVAKQKDTDMSTFLFDLKTINL
ncbi:MAG: hypothetical protein MUC49_02565 [Raineya sp.]|jgi:hypothetical protein|nr:hypothetical protein [Raineya sp.]